MGVPFKTRMEIGTIGRRPDGGEVVFSAAAAEANVIVVINRVKPPTDFRNINESQNIVVHREKS